MHESVADAEMVRSSSPQAPGVVLAEAPATTAAGVVEAARRGQAAQREWWIGGPVVRARALDALARDLVDRQDIVTDLMVQEVGKPVAEARAEVGRAISVLGYYSQQCYSAVGQMFPSVSRGRLWTERRPHGVAGLITPWNFPLAIPLWKAAPALAAGNAVLLKPSPDSLATAVWLGELANRTLPAGLFQVLPGGADTGAALVGVSDVVSFTGSAAVGREVATTCASHGVPMQAEMGGQNAAIVLPDADATVTATMIAQAAMGFAGQKCTATRRVVVVGGAPRQREIREALTVAVEAMAVGDPRQEEVAVGPVINSPSRDRVTDASNAVRAIGGRILTGGEKPDQQGWFVTPMLADGIAPDHPLTQEELFGPFAVVIAATDADEAVRIADGVRYGLVTSVHGRDVGDLLDVVNAVDTGMVKVNSPSTGVDFYAPFGGERDSSYGPREQGASALDFYASSRTVTFATLP